MERALARGVARGERSVAFVRIVAAGLALGSAAATNPLADILAGIPRFWSIVGGLVPAMALSAWGLRRRDRVHGPGALKLSIALDAAVVFFGVLPTAIWAREAYPGQIHMPTAYFFLMAIVASGLRLDRKLVALAALLNGVAVVTLFLVDLYVNGPVPLMGAADAYLFAALFFAAVALADAMARRTRRLVVEAGQAAARAERARQALGLYVSEQVADQALDTTQLTLGGTDCEVVVLFCDLRDFTAYSETLGPSALVSELKAYLDAMVRPIRSEGGLVDKYIGDAIMAVFGLPEAASDDALRAVRAALGMREALTRHNGERRRDGLPALRNGIGLHAGTAVAGNIGTRERLQYTVIGPVVNVASRLEAATKDDGVPVLISGEVAKRLGPEAATLLIPRSVRRLRGHEHPVQTFTLRPAGSP